MKTRDVAFRSLDYSKAGAPVEGKTFSHTFPINCSMKQRCQLYSTNVPEKTREQ